MTVAQRFETFLENIKITSEQSKDGETKHGGVRACLNKYYYNSTSETVNSLLVGSWGKHTRIRPPRDIDVMFVLPYSVYQRLETRPGNKQSQLLQEVKSVLAKTYTTTTMRADGQVVVVPFVSYAVEVVPAFKLDNGKYWICDTNGGGKYKTTDPDAEASALSTSDTNTVGKTRHLIRMMKKWQSYGTVPLKSFCIELLAADFLASWQYRDKTMVYYDYMIRDFLKYLIGKANGYVFVPGTSEFVLLSDGWKSRAESADARAVKACEYEAGNYPTLAGEEWQKIFGTYIPIS